MGVAVGTVVGNDEGILDGCDDGIHVGTLLGVAEGTEDG